MALPFFALALIASLTHSSQPSPTRQAKLSVVDWADYNHREPDGPGTYAFGYDIEDAVDNNVQFRSEERHPNGTVTGSYGYVQPDGNIHMVHYTADAAGYRARIENSRRGMLKPINIPDAPDATKLAGFSPYPNPKPLKLQNHQIVNKNSQAFIAHNNLNYNNNRNVYKPTTSTERYQPVHVQNPPSQSIDWEDFPDIEPFNKYQSPNIPNIDGLLPNVNYDSFRNNDHLGTLERIEFIINNNAKPIEEPVKIITPNKKKQSSFVEYENTKTFNKEHTQNIPDPNEWIEISKIEKFNPVKNDYKNEENEKDWNDFSPTMVTALKNQKVYKKQQVHEQRTRPKDVEYVHSKYKKTEYAQTRDHNQNVINDYNKKVNSQTEDYISLLFNDENQSPNDQDETYYDNKRIDEY